MNKRQMGWLAGAVLAGAGVLWGCNQTTGPAAKLGAITASEEAQKFGVYSYTLGEGELIATVYDKSEELGQLKVIHDSKRGAEVVFYGADGKDDKQSFTRGAREVIAFLMDPVDRLSAVEQSACAVPVYDT